MRRGIEDRDLWRNLQPHPSGTYVGGKVCRGVSPFRQALPRPHRTAAPQGAGGDRGRGPSPVGDDRPRGGGAGAFRGGGGVGPGAAPDGEELHSGHPPGDEKALPQGPSVLPHGHGHVPDLPSVEGPGEDRKALHPLRLRTQRGGHGGALRPAEGLPLQGPGGGHRDAGPAPCRGYLVHSTEGGPR